MPCANTPIEHCVVDISYNGLDLRVCYAYVPPINARKPSTWDSNLSTLLDTLVIGGKPFVLLNDFNRNLLSDASLAEELKVNYHLSQLITEPTRITATAATLLDLVYVSHCSIVSASSTENLHISDRNLTF